MAIQKMAFSLIPDQEPAENTYEVVNNVVTADNNAANDSGQYSVAAPPNSAEAEGIVELANWLHRIVGPA